MTSTTLQTVGDVLKAESRELVVNAFLAVDPSRWLRLKEADRWYPLEQARRTITELGRSLSLIWSGQAYLLVTRAAESEVRYASTAELEKLGRAPGVAGVALIGEKATVIDWRLQGEAKRAVLAHEAAHLLLPTVCDATEAGEMLAEAFSKGFMTVAAGQP